MCHTEHQRLIALFMNDQNRAVEAENAGLQGLNVEAAQGERLVPPFLNEQQAAALRIQLAAAPPYQQGTILREQVKRSVVAVVFQSLVGAVADYYMQQPFSVIFNNAPGWVGSGL